MDEMTLITAAAISAGSLGILHFALHPSVTGTKLPRVWAYALGVGIIGAVTTWLGLTEAQTPEHVLIIFWVCVWSGAVATVGGRVMRNYLDGIHARAERDELLRLRRGE